MGAHFPDVVVKAHRGPGPCLRSAALNWWGWDWSPGGLAPGLPLQGLPPPPLWGNSHPSGTSNPRASRTVVIWAEF